MADLIIPDVSEYQTVDFTKFSGPIIVRAHNGYRADYKFERHATGASKQPWWGVYQYLPAAKDAGDAARALLATLAGWRPNVTILDLEEGSGDQSARQRAWLDVMAGDPAVDWTYSGVYFARDHNLSNVQWVASYGSREPTTTHTLWQFSDSYTFPGIGPCDASVFHGTVDDLIRATGGTTPTPVPVPPVKAGEMVRLMRADKDPAVYVVSSECKRFGVPDQYWLADFANRYGAQILPATVGGPCVAVDTVNGVKVEVVNPLFLAPIPKA